MHLVSTCGNNRNNIPSWKLSLSPSTRTIDSRCVRCIGRIFLCLPLVRFASEYRGNLRDYLTISCTNDTRCALQTFYAWSFVIWLIYLREIWCVEIPIYRYKRSKILFSFLLSFFLNTYVLFFINYYFYLKWHVHFADIGENLFAFLSKVLCRIIVRNCVRILWCNYSSERYRSESIYLISKRMHILEQNARGINKKWLS